MSYYDFNNHFWSPKTVCGQSTLPKSEKKVAHKNTLLIILTLVCIAIWTPLLIQAFIPTTNENQEQSSLDTEQANVDLPLFRRERLLLYLFAQRQ